MNAEWDFSRLPEHEHATVIEAYKTNDARKLIEIHDQYKLSPHQYCCASGLMSWYAWAIENGTINDVQQGQNN